MGVGDAGGRKKDKKIPSRERRAGGEKTATVRQTTRGGVYGAPTQGTICGGRKKPSQHGRGAVQEGISRITSTMRRIGGGKNPGQRNDTRGDLWKATSGRLGNENMG